MKVKCFTFNPFQENSYILSDDTNKCIIIDPGCYDVSEENELLIYIEENSLEPIRLINTHAHIDHVFGNCFIASKFNLKLELHQLEVPVLEMAAVSANKYGLKYTPSPKAQVLLNEGAFVEFGNTKLEILHVPGHAPGHIVLYNRFDQVIIGGDVLFRGSIGRTDLPGGNHDDLIRSIREKLFVLDDEIVVFSGHGPETTIGYEKKHNPFF